MIKIAFKPHETRGEEIIKILEGLGGFNRYNTRKATATFKDTAYCVDERRIIIEMYEEELIESGYKIYTLEEWEKERDEMSLDEAGQITDFEYEGLIYSLPDGYIFKDENGNVINATKIVLEKKKKKYTKGTKVRHKTKGMVETIVGVCKIKYMGAWVDGVIYEGNDTNTGEPMTFVRVKEDFENNFESC